jgi:hypothetical protein
MRASRGLLYDQKQTNKKMREYTYELIQDYRPFGRRTVLLIVRFLLELDWLLLGPRTLKKTNRLNRRLSAYEASSPSFVSVCAPGSTVRPFAIAAAATEVARKALAIREGVRVRIPIHKHLILARCAGPATQEAPALDEERVHVRVPHALDLLLGISVSYEFDDAPRDQTENKPLQPIFRVRPGAHHLVRPRPEAAGHEGRPVRDSA